MSLIAVDWYIEKLRRKVNDSAPLKLTIPSEAYRGNKRNQVFFYNPSNPTDKNFATPIEAFTELAFIGGQTQEQTIMRSKNLFIPIDANRLISNGLGNPADAPNMVNKIDVRFASNKTYITKDELAVLDVITSNIYDRAIYFAVTCKNDKLLGLNDYMQLEGLGLRIIPVKSPSVKELSIYGGGRVAEKKVYNNVMNKWAFGGFDTEDTFVDESYAAEVQAMKIIMMRAAEEFLQIGDKQKAGDLAMKFFEGFPHMNFPYDDSVIPFIEALNQADMKEEAMKHTDILANELSQRMIFYDSLDEDDFESFKQDYGYALRGTTETLQVIEKLATLVLHKKSET